MEDPVRVAILSDLHLDIRRGELLQGGMGDAEADAALEAAYGPALEAANSADIVVLAGDISEGSAGIDWAGARFPARPVVYVAGNHEFYGHEYPALSRGLAAAAAATENVRFLENRAVVFDVRGRALRVLGCTLWTDYELHGAARSVDAMRAAESHMADHHWIRHGGGRFLPAHARALHLESRAWLGHELSQPFAGTTVVVTHHPPSALSNDPKFAGSPLSPAFASALDALVSASKAPLWIHGHTHYNVDYRIGATRVVSRQWGYPEEQLALEATLVEL